MHVKFTAGVARPAQRQLQIFEAMIEMYVF